MKKTILALTLVSVFALTACAPAAPAATADPIAPAAPTSSETLTGEPVTATMTMADGGVVVMELYPNIAPQSVCNFVSLARKGTYDGLTFHRIMSGFMIQGGDPAGDGMGKPEYNIKGEFKLNGFDNPLSHVRGTVSMARLGDPRYDSAGSQFFIVHQDSTFLDGSYAAFGKVISGMDVVDKIAAVKVDKNGKPAEKVVIKTITIDGPELPEPEKLK